MQETRQSTAYLNTIFELLGDKDPLAVQADLIPELKRRLEGLDDRRLEAREAPGKWCVLEIVEHLVDAETAHALRIRMTLCHDVPRLEGYDQDAFVERLRYDRTDVREALEELAVLRARNLRLLRDLTAEELARESEHAERGREPLRTTLAIIAGHDLMHLRQIDRILQATV